MTFKTDSVQEMINLIAYQVSRLDYMKNNENIIPEYLISTRY